MPPTPPALAGAPKCDFDRMTTDAIAKMTARTGNVQRSNACTRLCPKNADRKSTRLNSSHLAISYAVFCLKKNKCMGCQHGHDDTVFRSLQAVQKADDERLRPLGWCCPSPPWPRLSRLRFLLFFFNDRRPTEISLFPSHAVFPF